MHNYPAVKNNRHNSFLLIYFVYTALMVVNFFLTPDPYAASHSGRAGLGLSDSFFIAPAYIVILSLLVTILAKRQFILDYKIIIAFSILVISGMYNETLMLNFDTYFYNIIVFALVSSFAITTFMEKDLLSVNFLKLTKMLTIILFVGILLVFLFPLRYGYLPLDFSRTSRGEVTFWNITGLITLYPVMAIISYRKYKKKSYVVLSLMMSLILMSTFTRTHVALSLLPFLILIFFNSKPVIKVVSLFLTVPIALFFKNEILGFLFGVGNNLTNVTTGRLELWEYHFNTFTNNSLLGAGAFFKERLGGYVGTANSEVGALMWFSENGIIFGSILLFFILKSTYVSIKLLSKGRNINDLELFFSLIFLSMLPNLVQTYGRILNIDDIIFWFSVFYLNCYKKSLIPYISFLSERKNYKKQYYKELIQKVS